MGSCPFWLQCETSNFGLQQLKLRSSQPKIYLVWESLGWMGKNNHAEISWKAQTTHTRWKCSRWKSGEGSLHNWPPKIQLLALNTAKSINTDAAYLSLELWGSLEWRPRHFTHQWAHSPQVFLIAVHFVCWQVCGNMLAPAKNDTLANRRTGLIFLIFTLVLQSV